jgi:hypothetical protein
MATKYADLLKNAKDLLNKPFNTSNKLELKAKTENGPTLTAEAALSAPASTTLKLDQTFGDFKLDKFEIKSDKSIAVDFSLANALVLNLKLSYKAADAAKEKGAQAISSKVGLEYIKKDLTAITAELDVFGKVFNTDATVTYNNVTAGGAVELQLNNGVAVKNYGTALAYTGKSFNIAFQTKQFSSAVAAFHTVVSPKVSVAAQAAFPLKSAADAKDKVTLEFGASCREDANTVWTSKINNSGKVGLSYARQVSTTTKATVAAELDIANIASNDHKVGAQVAITL